MSQARLGQEKRERERESAKSEQNPDEVGDGICQKKNSTDFFKRSEKRGASVRARLGLCSTIENLCDSPFFSSFSSLPSFDLYQAGMSDRQQRESEGQGIDCFSF